MALHNDVFRQQIWEFFCNDLDSCLEVSRILQSCQYNNTLFKGSLNFTASLAVFSVINLAANFYFGKESTTDDIAFFLKRYFGKYYSYLKNKPFCKQFYVVFRHGLSHQFSPKAASIAMDFHDTWILKFDGTPELLPYLNIPAFYDITKKALGDFEHDLDNDKKLQTNFKTRYNHLIKIDYKKMRKLRRIFFNNCANLVCTTTT